MKKVGLVIVAVFLMLSGVTLAQQSAEGKKDSSMRGMTQEMMKGGKEGERMGSMVRMMKMREQCSAMMESSHDSEVTNQTQK